MLDCHPERRSPRRPESKDLRLFLASFRFATLVTHPQPRRQPLRQALAQLAPQATAPSHQTPSPLPPSAPPVGAHSPPHASRPLQLKSTSSSRNGASDTEVDPDVPILLIRAFIEQRPDSPSPAPDAARAPSGQQIVILSEGAAAPEVEGPAFVIRRHPEGMGTCIFSARAPACPSPAPTNSTQSETRKRSPRATTPSPPPQPRADRLPQLPRHRPGEQSPAIHLLARHAPVYPLKHRRLVPTHRPYRRRIHLRLAAMRGKGAQHRNQLVGERLQAQIRIPQAQIKRVCHLYRF